MMKCRQKNDIMKKQELGGTWKNWSENIWFNGPPGEKYIKFPKTQADLRAILADAKEKGIKVRASGQRHSQPPQIVEDNRTPSILRLGKKIDTYVVDMSLYKDIDADDPNVRMKVISRDEASREAIVVVNAGTREDEFEHFLATENLALKTVTAGGIFSMGGMTSNDVHGGSIKTGIFADTCSAFKIMLHDGSIKEIHDEDESNEDGFRPIQFARVNLGLLGIITQIFVKCDFREKQQSLQGRMAFVNVSIEDEFIYAFEDFVQHDRLETFYDPYTGGYMPLMWDLVTRFDESGLPNKPPELKMDTTEHAIQNFYGAPLQGIFFKKGGPLAFIEQLAEGTASSAQYLPSYSIINKKAAEMFVKTAMTNIATSQVTSAFTAYSEAWLQDAARCIFMSYFVELPNLGKEGLSKTFQLLNVVTDIVTTKGNFHISGPLEFRFVKAGDSIMSGTYNLDLDKTYVNLDIIAFIDPGKNDKDSNNYPKKLLRFMADVERKWFDAGGLPHQGKMYGFYDPDGTVGNFSTPFNDNFIKRVNQRRDKNTQGARRAFNKYREELDPNDMFLNDYLRKLVVD